jgi:DNA-binding response OmpR family regulator
MAAEAGAVSFFDIQIAGSTVKVCSLSAVQPRRWSENIMSEGLMTSRKLLVLDDNSDDRAALALSLKALGYEVEEAVYEQVSGNVSRERLDLIVWRHRPDPAAFLALVEIRSLTFYPPLLAVTDAEGAEQVATLLECGCDGVLTSSKDVLQLKAWVDGLLRRRDMYHRSFQEAEPLVRVGDLEIDVLGRMVRTNTRSEELTDREMKLLLELAQKPGQVRTRAELLEKVWGSVSEALAGTLNTHINRLRAKIEGDSKDPKYIIGVYGVGYKLANSQPRAEHTPPAPLDPAEPAATPNVRVKPLTGDPPLAHYNAVAPRFATSVSRPR